MVQFVSLKKGLGTFIADLRLTENTRHFFIDRLPEPDFIHHYSGCGVINYAHSYDSIYAMKYIY